MKTDFIFKTIINKYNNLDAAKNAVNVIERLNFDDDDTSVEIYGISESECGVRLHNNQVKCNLNFWDNVYSFSYIKNSDSKKHSIRNATFDEIINFLEKNDFLNDIRHVIIENLKQGDGKYKDLMENTSKILNVLNDDMFFNKCDYFINRSAIPNGVVICYFKDYKMTIEGNGLYGLYKSKGDEWVSQHKKSKMKFNKFTKLLSEKDLLKTKQCSYKDANLYILNIE